MGKVWFVTGANSGIGAGVVKAALQAGHQVVAAGRNMDKLRAAFAGAEGDSLALVLLDVRDPQQAQATLAEGVARFGRLDVLVNNAGNSILGNFEELGNDDLEKQLATNFFGVVNVMRAALPVMREQRSGHILNVSSTAGAVGLKHCAAYSASKFAVEGLTMATATEVEQFGIKMTIVEPGFFRTELLAPQNVGYAESTIADYASEGPAEAMWSPYNGAQTGDPYKLGLALVELASMAHPPLFFVGGSDGVAMVRPAVERRLSDMRDHEALSGSTDLVS